MLTVVFLTNGKIMRFIRNTNRRQSSDRDKPCPCTMGNTQTAGLNALQGESLSFDTESQDEVQDEP
jgi:hypothetical protein